MQLQPSHKKEDEACISKPWSQPEPAQKGKSKKAKKFATAKASKKRKSIGRLLRIDFHLMAEGLVMLVLGLLLLVVGLALRGFLSSAFSLLAHGFNHFIAGFNGGNKY